VLFASLALTYGYSY